MTHPPADRPRRVVTAAGIHTEPADDLDRDAEPRLRISICPACDSRWFPPRRICSRCAHDGTTETLSGRHGTAYASTVVRIGPPTFTAPYVLSYVDIDGVRILAHTDGTTALHPGTPVELTSGAIGHDGGTELWSYRVRAHRPTHPDHVEEPLR
jgi:uncharacterized protein